MKNVTVKKDRLLATLKENRETHESDFDIAWEAFREKALSNLTNLLDATRDAKKGQEINLWVNLDAPQNHSGDYDRAIEMIDWEVGDEVELTEGEFRSYVQDLWNWKTAFEGSNTFYTGSASPSRIA